MINKIIERPSEIDNKMKEKVKEKVQQKAEDIVIIFQSLSKAQYLKI
jgi:hypothetical protein